MYKKGSVIFRDVCIPFLLQEHTLIETVRACRAQLSQYHRDYRLSSRASPAIQDATGEGQEEPRKGSRGDRTRGHYQGRLLGPKTMASLKQARKDSKTDVKIYIYGVSSIKDSFLNLNSVNMQFALYAIKLPLFRIPLFSSFLCSLSSLFFLLCTSPSLLLVCVARFG